MGGLLSHCPKIIRGTWQLSQTHSQNESHNPVDAILDCIQLGQNCFDTADIYTGAEKVLGQCIAMAKREGLAVNVHTKFVPDLSALNSLNFQQTEAIIDRSLARLGIEQLALVQFHWWDFTVPRYLEVLSYLFELQKAGKVAAIGLTNFDTSKLASIVDEGFKCASIQCQVSLLDHRARKTLQPLCEQQGIKILSYGTLAGGFISEHWLGQPEPELGALANRSLVKYKLIIDDWGGWARFQDYLGFLQSLSQQYQSSIAQIARVAVLQSQRSDALIIGMSRTRWREHNKELSTDQKIKLTEHDLSSIFEWASPLQGDVYALERDRSGRHGSVMKYNLNKQVDKKLVENPA